MLGFGIMDNTILIHAGDAIEKHFGEQFGIKGLQAAACGQVFSDFCGVCFGGFIEALSRKHLMGPSFSPGQLQSIGNLRLTRFVGTAGAAIGVVCGCCIGMGNFLFLDLELVERRRRLAELETIFDTVIESAVQTMGCPLGTIFLIDEEKREIWSRAASGFEGVVHRPLDENASLAAWVAINKKPLVVENAQQDPRLCHDIDKLSGIPADTVLTYPVFSQVHKDKVVAVVQFFNKPGGFTKEDMRVTSMLCIHCAVFMAKCE